MTNQFINMAMGKLEDMTDQMAIHQANGNYDMVALLDQEARTFADEMDNGEFITLPQM
jgi:hypothetical protein